jgi:hypothetical protein
MVKLFLKQIAFYQQQKKKTDFPQKLSTLPFQMELQTWLHFLGF